MYFNAHSIVNKIDELQLLIEAEHPDVIGISETWLEDNIVDNDLIVNDYNIYRHDRVKKIGGGVLLLVWKGIKTIIREDLTNKFNEIVWCDLITINRKLIIGVCYRSPSITIEDEKNLYDLLNVVSKENFILMGDFNFGNSIDWKSNVNHGQDKIFLKFIIKKFLIQHVDHPPRDSNILDLIISSDTDLVKDIVVGENFGNSDHQIIRFNIVVTYLNDKKKKYRNYSKGNYVTAIEMANKVIWNTVMKDNFLKGWLNFKQVLLNIRDQYVPLSSKKLNKCKWVSRKVIKCRRS